VWIEFIFGDQSSTDNYLYYRKEENTLVPMPLISTTITIPKTLILLPEMLG
jgi:hypothetical protein